MSGRTEAEALEKAAKRFNVPKEKIVLEQGRAVVLASHHGTVPQLCHRVSLSLSSLSFSLSLTHTHTLILQTRMY